MLRLWVGATLLALTVAGGLAVAAHKTVTLTVDGAQMTVATMKSRVIDVVEENGFAVGDRPNERSEPLTDLREDRLRIGQIQAS